MQPMPEYPSRASLERYPWSKTAIIVVGILLSIDLVLAGITGYKWWKLYSVNQTEKNDATLLKESATAWRSSHNNAWPTSCIIDPGTPRLCESDKDRDEIFGATELAKPPSTIFVVDGEFIAGDITQNSLIEYGLTKNILILVNKSKCFQEKEVISGSEFAVIYNRSSKTGEVAACV